MKPYARKASVLWVGTRHRGKGAISMPSASLKMASYAAGDGFKRQGTNPPDLLAAAHAGSFSLTLANELEEAGYSPRQIDTTATVTMENLAAGWSMTQIHLDVMAAVPRVAECDFVDAALRAKASCPVSRALNANISMRAALNRQETPARNKRRGASGKNGPGTVGRNGSGRKAAHRRARLATRKEFLPTNSQKT
jgi:osmotically inducible protein OsmC